MEAKQTAVMLVLVNEFRNKQLNTKSAVDFSVNVYKIIHRVNKQQKLQLQDIDTIDMALLFLNEIAKGNDGVIGTADDLLEPKALDEITEMLRTSLINDVLNVVTDAVKLEIAWPRMRVLITKYCCLSSFKK
jgi:hypothetical protein